MDEFAHLLPDLHLLLRLALRISAVLLIGALVGLQRELTHKPAGLRTHMLVALGTALFIIGATEAGMTHDDLSRVVQGLATGIGFLGGGAILKLTTEREIHGLTTAAGIWMTAAASAAAALGQIAVGLLGVAFGLVVFVLFRKLEKHLGHRAKHDDESHPHSAEPQDLM